MAEYTPDAPFIVGNEWVPIKQDPYILDDSQEQGTSFALPTASTIVTGRMYVSDPPLSFYSVTADHLAVSSIMAVYPKGQEGQTGIIRSVDIPVSSATVFGHAAFSGPDATSSVQIVGDGTNIYLSAAAGVRSGGVILNFGVSGFPQLAGKRILDVSWVFSLFASPGVPLDNALLEHVVLSPFFPITIVQGADILSQAGSNQPEIPSVRTPRYNSLSNLPTSIAGTGPVYPWTYATLLNLQSTQAFRFTMGVLDGLTQTQRLDYAALRVTYCEEKRVLYGGFAGKITSEANTFELRGPSQAPGGALLPAGEYTVTVDGYGLQTELYTLRELYPMRDQTGVTINRSITPGEQFSVAQSAQMVQLSLHTASASVAAVHPYGIQNQSDVYTGLTPEQGIVNEGPSGGASFPWVRFYARRTNTAAQALTLRAVAAPLTAVSITPAEFDALDEITDGWKEVTLRFTGTAPTFTNAGTVQQFEWVNGDPSGSGWQILGASAIVKNGTFPLGQITGAHDLDEATYGGAAADLDATDWLDATLMFAQEMPAVSGLAISLASQEITGIGLDCGLVPPECVPSGLSYHQLTWSALSASSMPASGFGYYELQRSDTADPGVWETILLASSPIVTGFNDFEARAGEESCYRIRFVHRLGFESPWSAEVCMTLPAPGVTGANGKSALIFTSNERQDGSANLAYVMTWDGDPEEDFTFLEAGDVTFQKMYLRDYQVAFHGTERGGERFQRNILVQQAAVPTGRIRDGFRSLRDMAWEDLSYVCVRNDLGDRWLSAVLVPDGRVQRNRRLYMATVDIVEVTGTPSAVPLPELSAETIGGGIFGAAVWDGLPGWDYGAWSP